MKRRDEQGLSILALEAKTNLTLKLNIFYKSLIIWSKETESTVLRNFQFYVV